MAKVKSKVDEIEKASNIFMKLLDNFKRNWMWWIFIALFAFNVAIMASAVRLINDDKIFERYDKYVEDKHAKSNEYRIESVPLITAQLNSLAAECEAERVYVAEFHNGKYNPTGLQWQYVDMTFINDNCEDIRDEYQNVPVVKYPLSYTLYENGFFMGTVNEVNKIDHRLALRLEANDDKFVAAMMMYGTNGREIGFIGVSYSNDTTITRLEMRKILSKYTLIIAPYLDIENAKEKE